jgi:hypothetical protein
MTRFSTFAIVFAVAFSIAYVLVAELNLALFTYHPALGELGPGVEKSRDGPAMYWFGWLTTTTLIASAAGALACLLPEGVTRRLSPAWTWVVAIGAMIAFCYILAGLFLK